MSNKPHHGEIFIVSAPSGAGKSTLVRRVLHETVWLAGTVTFSVSHTTRPPREGERHGEHYFFVDRATFERMIGENRFLEWAEVHGRLYGTTRDGVFERLEQGLDVILEIDVQGARQVMAACPDAQAIFVLPPSWAELRRRLEGRNLDDPQQIARRLLNAAVEVRDLEQYPYVMINDDVDRASLALGAIILARRQRRERLATEIAGVLRDFPAISEP